MSLSSFLAQLATDFRVDTPSEISVLLRILPCEGCKIQHGQAMSATAVMQYLDIPRPFRWVSWSFWTSEQLFFVQHERICIPYAPCMEYLPTFARTKSPSFVGKYSIHGYTWSIWDYTTVEPCFAPLTLLGSLTAQAFRSDRPLPCRLGEAHFLEELSTELFSELYNCFQTKVSLWAAFEHPFSHWIGLQENLQETPIFDGKNHGFRLRFSLKPIQWFSGFFEPSLEQKISDGPRLHNLKTNLVRTQSSFLVAQVRLKMKV